MSFFFTKLAESPDRRAWYLQTLWEKEEFTVYATDCAEVWKGTADAQFIRTNLKPDELSATEYLDLIRPALTQNNPGEKYSCAMETGGGDTAGNVSVVWRVSLNRRLSLKGALVLSKVVDGAGGLRQKSNPMEIILDMTAERLSSLENVARSLQGECDDLRTKVSSTCAELAKIAERKSRLEMDMYKKFCVILNQKKEKIRTLKGQLATASHYQVLSQKQQHERDEALGRVAKTDSKTITINDCLDNDSAEEGDDINDDYDDDKISKTLNSDSEDVTMLDLLDSSLDNKKIPSCSIRRRHVADKLDSNESGKESPQDNGSLGSSLSRSSSSSMSLSGSMHSFQSLSSSSSVLVRKRSVQKVASPAKKRKTGKKETGAKAQPTRYKQLLLDNMDPDDLIGMADT